MDKIIKVENLFFSYIDERHLKSNNKDWILNNISFSIEEGEFVVIAGANGSGKSTLLRLIDLLYPPARGEIYLFGRRVSSISDPYEIRSKIGFVFQDPKRQIINTTVLDEIVFGPENLGIPRSEIKRRLEKAVELTGIKNLMKRRTDELSGGQRQLIAIASVLTMEPEIFLFDEPTSMLHPEYHDRIVRIIQNLNKIGKTIILVTHNSDDFLIGNRLLVMKSGNLIYDADPKNFFRNSKHFIEKSGLEVPFPLRLSLGIRDKLGEFPLCINIEEILDLLLNVRNVN